MKSDSYKKVCRYITSGRCKGTLRTLKTLVTGIFEDRKEFIDNKSFNLSLFLFCYRENGYL